MLTMGGFRILLPPNVPLPVRPAAVSSLKHPLIGGDFALYATPFFIAWWKHLEVKCYG